MKFYVKKYGKTLSVEKEYPCVVLTTDDWNDYSVAETLFHARYYEDETMNVYLNEIKIMHKKESITRNILSESFDRLNDDFCSLGQNANYYKLLKGIHKLDRDKILRSLNDAAIHKKYREMYEEHSFFKSSLIRFSEASKVLIEAKKIIKNEELEKNNYEFKFSCKLERAEEAHEIFFDFKEDLLPYRVNAFVGKNATGKTSILNEIAKAMSGADKVNNSEFFPSKPLFSKVITISYSAFDEMHKPFKDESIKHSEKKEFNPQMEYDENKMFSYIYCGLRSSKGILEIEEMEKKFWRAYGNIKELRRLDTWIEILSNIFDEDFLKEIDDNSRLEKNDVLIKRLSSGQSILLYTMSEVIANIQKESLLMFDEPETHLHPNAIANFMRLFYSILEKFDSYAIISTHSPLIMQEIPSKYTHIFNRYGNTTLIAKPETEFFGENISNITNDLFEVQEHESNYKSYIKSMLENIDEDELFDLFEEGLSFNALTYINSLSNKVKKQ